MYLYVFNSGRNRKRQKGQYMRSLKERTRYTTRALTSLEKKIKELNMRTGARVALSVLTEGSVFFQTYTAGDWAGVGMKYDTLQDNVVLPTKHTPKAVSVTRDNPNNPDNLEGELNLTNTSSPSLALLCLCVDLTYSRSL